MRDRREDLGRLMVMLDKLSEHEVFEYVDSGAKRFPERFRARTPEEQDDILHAIGYGLQHLKEELIECWSISAGTDRFNEKEDIS